MSWAQFLKTHWEVLAATDLLTVAVATWHSLVTYYVLCMDGISAILPFIYGLADLHGILNARCELPS